MDFECMKKIVEDRHSVRKFTGEPIDKGLMEEILGYALRCPTSMNTQPYKMILVRDQDKKEELAKSMEAGNDETVRTSGATVIICSDNNPVQSVKDFGEYVYSDDQPPKLRKMMQFAFVAYYNNTILNFLFGWIMDLFLWFGRLFMSTPARITNQAWSFQQASFLIEDLVLLAQSKGVSSLIMEGFSEAGVRKAFNIPKRYQIASIVSFGYEPKDAVVTKTPRFPLNKVVYEKKWGHTFENCFVC